VPSDEAQDQKITVESTDPEDKEMIEELQKPKMK
jgi:hypothetical protein